MTFRYKIIFGLFDNEGKFITKKEREKDIEKDYKKIKQFIIDEGGVFELYEKDENFFITDKDPGLIGEEEMRNLSKFKINYYPGGNQKIIVLVKNPTLIFDIVSFLKSHSLEFEFNSHSKKYTLKTIGIYDGYGACIVLCHSGPNLYEISVNIYREFSENRRPIKEIISHSKDNTEIIEGVNKAIDMITGVEERQDKVNDRTAPIIKIILDIEFIIKNTDEKNEMLKKIHTIRNRNYGILRFDAMYQNASPTTSTTMQLLNERVSAILNKM